MHPRVLPLCAVAVAGLAIAGAGAASRQTTPPTFTRDVAPILFNKCAGCHRPGEVAPMPLVSYQDARPWSRAIKQKVLTREMPPWHADPEFGRFRDSRRLTDREIETVVAWVDAGAPQGAEKDLPPLPEFPTGWRGDREPDYVLEMPVELEVPPEGELDLIYMYQPVPFAEDKFVEALEMRPGNPAVVHHISIHIVDLPPGARVADGRVIGPDGSVLGPRDLRPAGTSVFDNAGLPIIFWVPGGGLNRTPPGVATRIPAGKYIKWDIHYSPTGRPETDRSRVGFWFARKPATHEVFTRIVGSPFPTDAGRRRRYIVEGADVPLDKGRPQIPNIPPHAENWEIIGITPVTEDITIHALAPHMHLRGKDMRFVLIWPDGREEIILNVPKYDFNWQIHYELEQPLKVPAGSQLKCIAHYDNSLRNPYNPAPGREVFWAEQSWDEMFQGYVFFTIDRLDLSKPHTIQPQ